MTTTMMIVHTIVLAYALRNLTRNVNAESIVLAIYALILIVSRYVFVEEHREEKSGKDACDRDTEATEDGGAGKISESSECTKDNEKEAVAMKPSEKGIEILLARYGTTSRDIDVTTKIKELIRDDVLTIPATLDFNTFFGKDPSRFSKKKLRLVALVNKLPVAHFLRESRRHDFVLRADVHSASGDDDDRKEDDVFEDEEIKTETKTTTNTSEVVELLSTQPVMTNIYTKFSRLLSQLPFGNVDTESLMSACDEIASLIGLFGASMLSVRASVTDNLVKIRKQLAMLDVGSDLRIETVIFAERDRGVMKKEGSVCLSMLWLKRSLDFMGAFLHLIRTTKGTNTTQCALNAHSKTLAPWQGWFVRTACTTGMKLVPSRESMYRVFGRTETSDPSKIEDDLKTMLVPFNKFVGKMDLWFEENGFNFPEKC